MQRDRWSWRARAQGRAADTGSACSAGFIGLVEEALRRITPKLLRCIGSLQRRTFTGRSGSWASCTLKAWALLKTPQKRCGGTSLLPPKDKELKFRAGTVPAFHKINFVPTPSALLCCVDGRLDVQSDLNLMLLQSQPKVCFDVVGYSEGGRTAAKHFTVSTPMRHLQQQQLY